MAKAANEDFKRETRLMVDQMVLGDEEVSNWVRKTRTIASVTRLPGDASTRRYYRVTSSTGHTYIVARVDAFAAEGVDQYPFLAVQRHLARCGIDVPEILDVDPERGFMLLEDLGDITLLRRLQEVSSADVERHYFEGVLDSLIQLQLAASRPSPGSEKLDCFKLRFDHEKLMWEMNFTIEHFYQVYLNRSISDKDLKTMRNGLSEICQFLADQPTVLAHRDFHSRNVMLTPGESSGPRAGQERLVMIDFQDARMGPAQYDLVSLLKDSYYQLEEYQIQRLIDYYIVCWEAKSGQKIRKDEFIQAFDLMSVQRNFKAIGSFASFLNRRGNATYLKYIGNTFENIRRTLLKYPRYSDLREVLFHYYYF